MNFDFSEDQKLLKEQVSRFLADNCPIEIVREVLEGDDFYSEKVDRIVLSQVWSLQFQYLLAIASHRMKI